MPVDLVVRQAGVTPVKGMRHPALDRIQLDDEGPVGDRAFCLVDAGQARVLRTVQNPSLMAVVARLEAGVLEVRLPTGESVSAPPIATGETITCDYWGRQVDVALTDGPHAELVSSWLGRDVRLARPPRGGVVFNEPVTIVGTASLEALGERVGHPELVDQAARFRATLVVDTDEPFVEDSWLGREVRVGEATVRIGGTVPRCAVIDHHPETGVKDVRLLKALAQQRPVNAAGEPMFGVYATCVRPGEVAVTR
jgi:hypothetical protein